MANYTYRSLNEAFKQADPSLRLYDEFFEAAIDYYTAVVRAENARGIGQDGLRTHLYEQREGSLAKLRAVTERVNPIFATHQPPLAQLSTDSSELSTLVGDLIKELWDNRRR